MPWVAVMQQRPLGALLLEARTPHVAFTIGLFQPFSWPSWWNQPPLRYSSMTPSAQMQQCPRGPSLLKLCCLVLRQRATHWPVLTPVTWFGWPCESPTWGAGVLPLQCKLP
jgi:hypothetical protein